MSQELLSLSTDAIKIHPRNIEFFDDIDGDDYKQLKESIALDGIRTPLKVSPDMTLISGHQRLRIAKELNLQKIPVLIDDDANTDDDKLRLLISYNFGRIKNNESKQRKAMVTYVDLVGNKHGGDRSSNSQNENLNLGQIAKQFGISKASLSRAIAIERNLTDEMKELLDMGMISKTLASDCVASLSREEQEELFASFGDVTKKLYQKDVQHYIDEIKSKDKAIKDTEKDNETMRNDVQKFQNENAKLKKQIETMTKDSPKEQYEEQLKNSCLLFCSKVSSFIEKVGGYVWLTEQINRIPEFERRGYVEAVNAIKAWADTMDYNLRSKLKEVEVYD